MHLRLKLVCLFAILFITNVSKAQSISWNYIDDSLTLSPTRISANGMFTLFGTDRFNYGKMVFLLNEEVIFFKDSANLFKIKYSDIGKFSLDEFTQYSKESLSQKTFKDSILKSYRALKYKSLNLNEIDILFSKKNKYESTNEGLKVKKPLYLKGKICSINSNGLILLTEDGELEKVEDGDFINLKFGNTKAFECNELYSLFYKKYNEEVGLLFKSIDSSYIKLGVAGLIDLYGPFTKDLTMPNGKKLYVWDKPSIRKIYNSISLMRDNTYNYMNPFYSNGNNFLAYSISNSFSSNYTSGSVSEVNDGFVISLTVDSQNIITDVYHEGIIKFLSYGANFKFVNF